MLDGDVGVTDASSGDLDYDFIGRRVLKVHLREGERPAHFLNHRSRDLHPLPLFFSTAFGPMRRWPPLRVDPTNVGAECADPFAASVAE